MPIFQCYWALKWDFLSVTHFACLLTSDRVPNCTHVMQVLVLHTTVSKLTQLNNKSLCFVQTWACSLLIFCFCAIACKLAYTLTRCLLSVLFHVSCPLCVCMYELCREKLYELILHQPSSFVPSLFISVCTLLTNVTVIRFDSLHCSACCPLDMQCLRQRIWSMDYADFINSFALLLWEWRENGDWWYCEACHE